MKMHVQLVRDYPSCHIDRCGKQVTCVNENTSQITVAINTKQFNMPRLTAAERERAVGLLEGGFSTRQVAQRFNCHQSTIVRLSQRLRQTGHTRDRQRPGQPRVTTPRQDRLIVLTHLRNRFQPATHTAATIHGRRGIIHPMTVRRRLRQHGLRPRRPYVGPILTPPHRQRRLEWARRHRHWIQREWEGVLFSDESRFHLSHGDGRVRVWRRRGERFANCCVQQVDRWGGGSVMVWGGISAHGRTPLHVLRGRVTAVNYTDEVLRNHVIPHMAANPRLRTFQQDNARPHIARHSMAFLQQHHVDVLPWPALSPDLAPIEHLWDEMRRRLRLPQPPPHSGNWKRPYSMCGSRSQRLSSAGLWAPCDDVSWPSLTFMVDTPATERRFR